MVSQKIEYTEKVYLYSSGMPEELIDKSKTILQTHGVDLKDLVIIESPENVPQGAIMITLWPHYLSVAKVKRVREGSIYAPQLFNIDLWLLAWYHVHDFFLQKRQAQRVSKQMASGWPMRPERGLLIWHKNARLRMRVPSPWGTNLMLMGIKYNTWKRGKAFSRHLSIVNQVEHSVRYQWKRNK